jgi:hypothetical protein
MKKCFFIFILFSQSLVSVAQFTDDFSDGALTIGDTGMYIIWMEVFSENGDAERFKKVVVLSR